MLFSSCNNTPHTPSPIFGEMNVEDDKTSYDLEDIELSGDLIAGTLSGPTTYFEYHGREFGLEYSLASAFASTIGTRLRIEIYSDTTILIRKLLSGDIDLVALPVDSVNAQALNEQQITLLPSQWIVRSNSPALASAINNWWKPTLRQDFLAAIENKVKRYRSSSHRVPQPMILDRQRGIISHYDNLFKQYAAPIGWDWKLLAAQCYQESAFDAKAVSWMGAQGLMQLMPATALEMGLDRSNVFHPEANIAAGTRYLALLYSHFADIQDNTERIHFVLASYNGGEGHIRDAMSLAKKYHRNPSCWKDVATFVYNLSSPRYYRDPCVKRGYMRGSETVDYVQSIYSHYTHYQRLK